VTDSERGDANAGTTSTATGASRGPDAIVVGGGMVGLTTALRLVDAGRRVTLLEAGNRLGGLASPWELDAPDLPGGSLTWDRFYHVTLASDSSLRALLRRLDLDDEIEWGTTRTGVAVGGRQYPVSSPVELLRLSPLPLLSRVRLGVTVLLAARVRDIDALDDVALEPWLRRRSGDRAFESFWRPQLRAKLGDAYTDVSASFIAVTAQRLLRARREGLREERFGYVPGGYARVLAALEHTLRAAGVSIITDAAVERIETGPDDVLTVTTTTGIHISASDIVLTIPSGAIADIASNLSADERSRLRSQRYQGVVCVSLLLRERLSPFYLTYLLDDSLITGVVDMTSLVSPERFGGHSLVYLPRYQAPTDPLFDRPDGEIIDAFTDALAEAYPVFRREWVISAKVARARAVFTVPTLGSRRAVIDTATSKPGVWIVNGSQILSGTLNVDESVALANASADRILRADRVRNVGVSSVVSPRSPAALPRERFASLSLDVDNEWSYLMVRGAPGWQEYPTYLPALLPRIVGEFENAGIRATFFVVGMDAVRERNREPLRALAEAGHEIGNHSHRHESWLHRYTEAEVRQELTLAEEAIHDATGFRTRGFRGPGYSLSPAVLRVLVERDYAYDASTLPSVIGPIARAFYKRTANLTGEQQVEREQLFGTWSDGLRSLRPYAWPVPETGRSLAELPVTTLPLLRLPIHLSYLHMLAQVSVPLALGYVDVAMRLCDARSIDPSILLHPLDFLGGDEVPSLAFLPAMNWTSRAKAAFTMRVLERLQSRYEFVTMHEHLDRVVRRGPLPGPGRLAGSPGGASSR
jgi:protoporphyrinogen oxidase